MAERRNLIIEHKFIRYMNESIFSLAYLQYTYEVLGKDIIDPYIPMFCKCIVDNNINPIDIKKLKEAMASIYGISNLTFGAVQVICDRMATQKVGIIEKKDGVMYVNKDKLYENQASLKSDDTIIEQYDNLVTSISEYSQKFPKAYDRATVDAGLMNFIESHGIDLFCGQGKQVYDSILKHEDKRLSYVISKYVIEDKERGGHVADLLSRLAKGNAISNLVSLSSRSNFSGSLKNVTVIIDTPFFYNLLGANCESNREAAEELMTILQRNGAHFSMYQHNLHEVYSTLDDAVERLRTNNYLYEKSSRLLKMAIAEGFSSMQMDAMRSNVEVIRSNWNIADEGVPDCPNGYKDIDTAALTEIITDAYTNNHNRGLFNHEVGMIAVDVDSICYTYRIRGNAPVQSLKGCKALMLTTNKIIANTSNDRRINVANHKIPVCATDIFLSCILWCNYPRENNSLNKKLLISECYNNILLDDTLLTAFYNDIKAKRLANSITENQYNALATSRLAIQLLGEKTQNDIDAYTDRTSTEILHILEQEHKDELNRVQKEADAKVEAAKKESEENKARIIAEHMVQISEKDAAIGELKARIDVVDGKCKRIANAVSFVVMLLLSFALFCGFFAKRYIPETFWDAHYSISWIWYTFDSLLSFWAFLNWFGWIWKFADLKTYIYNKTYENARRLLME